MKAVRGVAWGSSLVPRVVPSIAAIEVGQVSLANQTQVDSTRDIDVGAPVLGAGIPLHRRQPMRSLLAAALTPTAATASPLESRPTERNADTETVDDALDRKVVDPCAVSTERTGAE